MRHQAPSVGQRGGRRTIAYIGSLAGAAALTLSACSSGAGDQLSDALPAAIDAVTSATQLRSDMFVSIEDGSSETTFCLVTRHSDASASFDMSFDARTDDAGIGCTGDTPAAGVTVIDTSLYALDDVANNASFKQATTTADLAATVREDLAAQQVAPAPLKDIVAKAGETTSAARDGGGTSYTLPASYADVTALIYGQDASAVEPSADVAQVEGDLTVDIDGQGRLVGFTFLAQQSAADIGESTGQEMRVQVWYMYDSALATITPPAAITPGDVPHLTTRADIEAFTGV